MTPPKSTSSKGSRDAKNVLAVAADLALRGAGLVSTFFALLLLLRMADRAFRGQAQGALTAWEAVGMAVWLLSTVIVGLYALWVPRPAATGEGK